ncbi:hypothetical protein ACQUD0_11060 [Vagococcus fluvialis]|uniref:hypothetical protein n=1 Tax=Vagococcus fluvialis TaxID=2738 RepID=UPI003D0B0144
MKKVEASRQVLRKLIGIGLVVIVLIVGVVLFFQNKNQSPAPIVPDTTESTTPSSQSEETTESSLPATSESVIGGSDYLLKLTAEERAAEATDAFESWYNLFMTGDVILEVNEELLAEDATGASPIDLQNSLIDNLKAKFGAQVSEDFYTSLQQSFNFNPIVIDSEKGLTIVKQNEDKSQWLMTWFLDALQEEDNTKIILRNDFAYEYFDWRNQSEESDKTRSLLTEIDWNSDLSYETVGISLMHSEKIIDSAEIVFVVMHYNQNLNQWQVSGSIGGIL